MSHFAVMIIGPNVEQQLAPFHEFECTGTNDEHVQDIDQTDEHRHSYETDTRTMMRLTDGALVDGYEPICYRDPTIEELDIIGPTGGSGRVGGIRYESRDWGDGKGYRTKVRYTLEGAKEVQVPHKDLVTFREYIESWVETKTVPHGQQPDIEGDHKYGYATLTAEGEVDKVIRRTNPEKKWDWWVVGGRWSGFLKLKPGAHGEAGRKGVIGSCADDGPGRADATTKGAIDFEGMRDEAGKKAAERWDQAAAAHCGQSWEPWSVIGPRTGYDDVARKTYNEQPAVQALRKVFNNPFHDIDQYLTPRDQFIQQARDSATVLYAFVKDGQWVGKGEMGWFGMSSGDADQGEWSRKVNEMLDALPDDTQITVVDCHI